MGTGIGADNGTAFGPNGCVTLAKTPDGTCVLSTDCGAANTSGLEFAFVCLKPDSLTPKSVHSFGFGGFAATEHYDTKVQCDSCTTVDYAQRTGGALVHNDVMAVLTSGKDAPPAQAPPPAPVAPAGGNRHPQQAALFGPSACVATFLSSTGTCLIQTRCQGVDISAFAMGITCLDAFGDYTRYLFGKGAFDQNETFDTALACKGCLGVGDQPVHHLRGVLPKTLVEDISRLKGEVQLLRGEVDAIRRRGAVKQTESTTLPPPSQDNATSDNATSDNATVMTQDAWASGPAIMLAGTTRVPPVPAKSLKDLLRNLAR